MIHLCRLINQGGHLPLDTKSSADSYNSTWKHYMQIRILKMYYYMDNYCNNNHKMLSKHFTGIAFVYNFFNWI